MGRLSDPYTQEDFDRVADKVANIKFSDTATLGDLLRANEYVHQAYTRLARFKQKTPDYKKAPDYVWFLDLVNRLYHLETYFPLLNETKKGLEFRTESEGELTFFQHIDDLIEKKTSQSPLQLSFDVLATVRAVDLNDRHLQEATNVIESALLNARDITRLMEENLSPDEVYVAKHYPYKISGRGFDSLLDGPTPARPR